MLARSIGLVVLFLGLVVGTFLVLQKTNLLSLASLNCKQPVFVEGNISSTKVNPGDEYTLTCSYDSSVDSIAPLSNGGSCAIVSYDGKKATFKCKAGNQPGVYPQSCRLVSGTASNTCVQVNPLSDLTIGNPGNTCRKVDLFTSTLEPQKVSPGENYSLSCSYTANIDSISPAVPSSECKFVTYDGQTAKFDCIAPLKPGSYTANCRVVADTKSNTCATSNSIGTLSGWPGKVGVVRNVVK